MESEHKELIWNHSRAENRFQLDSADFPFDSFGLLVLTSMDEAPERGELLGGGNETKSQRVYRSSPSSVERKAEL